VRNVCYWHKADILTAPANVRVANLLPCGASAAKQAHYSFGSAKTSGSSCPQVADLTAFLYQRMRDYCIGLVGPGCLSPIAQGVRFVYIQIPLLDDRASGRTKVIYRHRL
jgi:hypothetical protein